MMRNKHAIGQFKTESGNVFLFVLLGVALFAALAFTVSRGMKSATTSNLSARETELAVSEIVSFAQKVERAVNRLRNKGLSENDISFAVDAAPGYDHTPPQPDANAVFHPDGGSVAWQNPPAGVNDGSPWLFTGSTCVKDIGTGGAGCDSDSASNEELLLVLDKVKEDVCTKMNQKLGIAATPTDSGGGFSSSKFTGTFADGTEITLPSAYNAACYTDGTDYTFYYVLLAR